MNLLKEIEGASIKRTLRHVSVDESKPTAQTSVKPSDVLKNVRAGEGGVVKPSAMRNAAFGSTESRSREASKAKESSFGAAAERKGAPFAGEQKRSLFAGEQKRSPLTSEQKSTPLPAEQKHSPSTKATISPEKATTSREERIITASRPITRSCPQGEGWEERMTVDGVPYYYNKSTDCLSWEKPDCLRTEEEKKEGSTHWAWLEDDGAWVPVCVVGFAVAFHRRTRSREDA